MGLDEPAALERGLTIEAIVPRTSSWAELSRPAMRDVELHLAD